jgi:GNAT superfamily N-acetyltransferase
MEIRAVRYTAILDAKELLSEYAKECSIPEIGEANPQRDLYERMEATGLMHTFGAFHMEQLIGFASVLLYVLPHYGRKVATMESLFVTRPKRTLGAGRKLMRVVEDFARREGCEVLMYSARAGTRLERLLLLLTTYKRTNSVFLRRL